MAKEKEDVTTEEKKDTAPAEKTETKKTTRGRKKSGVESNTKALDFQSFLVDNNINVFSTETLEDDYQTVIFRSRIETKGQILPTAVLIDTSIFTILRTQIVTGVAMEKRDRIVKYLNGLNAQYKIFKYYLREDGSIYLDICLPFVDETFDSKMIQLMLSVLVQHLEATYDDLMAEIWKKD
ncbi:YbjN domain-containing protein [Selenomonas sp.]|uniref:YbjN domain-containing protein n=1 Tax=Selenomonas sp. TaxID=2053611 RepID=UPI002A7561EB|nr:YbjN domain-containing protein [Selenomonas sp.]MDY3296674.1 YbjN domain-containing protein [Selenomonas sp.]